MYKSQVIGLNALLCVLFSWSLHFFAIGSESSDKLRISDGPTIVNPSPGSDIFEGQTITFEAFAFGKSSRGFMWDFGDNSTPVNTGLGSFFSDTRMHTYSNPGTYTVTLTVYHGPFDDPFRFKVSRKIKVTILPIPKPIARFTVDNNQGLGSLVVNFNATASNDPAGDTIVNYFWDFGDLATDTTNTPFNSHFYAAPGDYVATLQVQDSSGDLSEIFRFSIFVGNDQVGDSQLFIKTFKYGINVKKTAQGPPADTLSVTGFFNPSGLNDDVKSFAATLSINDVEINGTIKISSDGTFTFSAKGLNLQALLGLNGTDGNDTITRSRIRLSIDDGSRIAKNFSNTVESSARGNPNSKLSGAGSFIPRPGLQQPAGAFNAPRFNVAEQVKSQSGHTFVAKGAIKADTDLPVVPTGDVTILIGTPGSGQPQITIPVGAFTFSGSAPNIISSFNAKNGINVPELQSLRFDAGKRSFAIKTNEILDTGIPLAGDNADTSFLLPTIFTVTTASGPITFTTNLEMRRRSSNATRWTNR